MTLDFPPNKTLINKLVSILRNVAFTSLGGETMGVIIVRNLRKSKDDSPLTVWLKEHNSGGLAMQVA